MAQLLTTSPGRSPRASLSSVAPLTRSLPVNTSASSQPSTTWSTSLRVSDAPQSTTPWDSNEAPFQYGASYHSNVLPLPPSPSHFNLSNGHALGPSTYMGYPDATHVPPLVIPCRGHFLRCTGGYGSSCEGPVNLDDAARQTNFAGFRQHGHFNQPFSLTDTFSSSITGHNDTSFYNHWDISPNFHNVYSDTSTTGFLDRGNPTHPSQYPDDDFGGVSGGYSELRPARVDSYATELCNIDPILLNMGQAGELFEDRTSMKLTNDTSPQRFPSSPSDQTISPYATSRESSSDDDSMAPQPKVGAKSRSPSETRPCPFCPSFEGDARALREHIRCHDRSHGCPAAGCDKTFSTPRDLERHQMSAHQKIALICHICGAPTKGGRSDNLQRHIKKRHPEIFRTQ
ncbi:hypothetical protein CSOJ01_08421 [Colletotrichum sojae]|uniref:C2H2-type domain-containing protein n=1 Tax=Colletotrichum sojae TaxID=2175907 RepID=A0A8H6MT06_9PEZI|nr:hypothetical protein CSOJ01_08421 [Colletotrichum sojae]